jgi:hypothetical protein
MTSSGGADALRARVGHAGYEDAIGAGRDTGGGPLQHLLQPVAHGNGSGRIRVDARVDEECDAGARGGDPGADGGVGGN